MNNVLEFSDAHKETKEESYWINLVQGETGLYKTEAIKELLSRHFTKRPCGDLLDIGVGTCEFILSYAREREAQSVHCMDYDQKIIAEMRSKHVSLPIQWHVADIFEIGEWGQRFDLVFLLDMLHEVYSIYGRTGEDPTSTVDHVRGLSYVARALKKVSDLVEPGGGIVITDNLLPDELIRVRFVCRHEKCRQAVEYFLVNYPTKNLSVKIHSDGSFEIDSNDFCTLLTQYNKIKQENWERWNTERMEIHQYMSLSEYRREFKALGYEVFATVGTPSGALSEWQSDFELLEGWSEFAPKRITLFARKNE
ncbi:MAG: class I SAM-dependent methyltransferase [Bdellovibrionales bacterium]|nr:class I SAM-dependent methyltransferase [Bdellovibrionales bacterium]